MKKREVEVIVAAPDPHYVGNGFNVHNFIPSTLYLDMRRLDPFLFLDYNAKMLVEASEKPKGVEPHPHRGFETVTVVYRGKVAHRDNHGGGGVIKEGEVQWMTAGAGVIHEEMHDREWAAQGGYFHMIQLWINLPAKHKFTAPKYQALTSDIIGYHKLDGGVIEVIAGEYGGTKGPASTFTPIEIMNLKGNKGLKVPFSFPEEYNTAMVVVEGKIKVNGGENISPNYLVLMDNEGSDYEVEILEENTIVFVMSGKPLREPISAEGPFVLNTIDELAQAYRDYHSGNFGMLEVQD